MVLPLIIFELLLVIGIVVFLFGLTRQGASLGFAFLLLSAVIFIVTGAMLWSGGLQLNTVSDYINNPDGSIGVVYDTATTNQGEPLWVISNVLFYGGLGLALLSLGSAFKQRRMNRQAEYDEQSN
jgi:hypothetical protein